MFSWERGTHAQILIHKEGISALNQTTTPVLGVGVFSPDLANLSYGFLNTCLETTLTICELF